MIEISRNTKEIQHSKIRKMFNKALEYDNVISFTIGEPDFTASENVVKAGCEAISKGLTKYSENAGILPLRQTIAEYLKRALHVNYNSETEIVVTTGAMGALYLTLKVLLNPGDEVIINEPCWTNYIQQIKMCDAVPVAVPTKVEEGFTLDMKKVREAITGKTKAIIINSPCNPTGAVLSKTVLQELADLAKEKEIVILSDEVYKHILFDEEKYVSIASFEDMKKRTVVIDSLSKTYAMTGWRVGYAAGPEEIVKNVTKLQENVAACVAMPCQYAAMEALRGPQNHLEHMVKSYKERRDYVMKRVDAIKGVSGTMPKGTFYAFLSIKDTGISSEEFSMGLLEKKQVVVVPGTAFGDFGEGYIRISYATSMENLVEGLNKIEDYIREECNEGKR